MQKKYNDRVKAFFFKDYVFFIIFFAGVILSLALIIPLSKGLDKLDRKMLRQVTIDAGAGIQTEADYLLNQSKEMAENRIFDRFLSDGNAAGLISLSTEEARKRNIGGILIADKSGQVLSRVYAVSQRGDFVFHSTFWGKEAFEKGESYGVEAGATHPIIVFGAKRLEKEGQVLGLLVSAQIPDDKYANVFANKYLPDGAKVAFISKEDGLTGSNFDSSEERRLVEIYFSPDSGFNDKNGAELKASFNGGDYLVKNIVFESGYNGPIGNMIIFVPLDYNREALVLSIIITVFLALSLFVAVHFDRHMHRPILTIIVISTGIITIFLLTYFYSREAFRKEYLSLSSPPYLIYNSVMTISPNSATISTNFEHIISINIISGGESINVVEVEIRYDPTLLMVQEIKTTNSFCDQNFFVEKEIDNDNGMVRVVCGLPSPGFNDLKGVAFELAVRALKPGRASLWFGENTAVLANDGLGTNVLRNKTDASYLIVSGEMLARSNASESLLFSPSHPNLTRWYNNRTIIFTWLDFDANRYKYLLDKSIDVELDDRSWTTDSLTSFEIDSDGIHHFHLLAENTDGTVHRSRYPVKIDTTPPDAPLIRASALDVLAGGVVRFEFSSHDELSGLQSGFYVK